MLQERDAEKVTEVNETVDKLHADISALNRDMTKRMNQRLTLIGILLAAVFIMAGVIVNLLLKISRMKKQLSGFEEEDEESEDDEAFVEDADYFDEGEEAVPDEDEISDEEDDEFEILDLDDMD